MRPRLVARTSLALAIIALAALACAREDAATVTDAASAGAVGAPPPSEEARSVAGFEGGPATAPSMKLGATRGEMAAMPAAPQPPAALPGAAVTALPDSGTSPMIIRSGNASVEVDSLERAIAAVRALAARAGATIGSTMQQGGRDAVRSATIELRVAAPRFDLLVGGLDPLGRVEHVNVQAQDVGEEYVDIAARVANARRLEARLVQLLATRTGRLEDVLAVERELARVREEIERHEGRMRYLRTRAAVSTLSVTVHERAPLVASHPGAHPMRDALVEAWRRFVATTAAVIVGIGALLPLVLAVALGLLIARIARRRWIVARAASVSRS